MKYEKRDQTFLCYQCSYDATRSEEWNKEECMTQPALLENIYIFPCNDTGYCMYQEMFDLHTRTVTNFNRWCSKTSLGNDCTEDATRLTCFGSCQGNLCNKNDTGHRHEAYYNNKSNTFYSLTCGIYIVLFTVNIKIVTYLLYQCNNDKYKCYVHYNGTDDIDDSYVDAGGVVRRLPSVLFNYNGTDDIDDSYVATGDVVRRLPLLIMTLMIAMVIIIMLLTHMIQCRDLIISNGKNSNGFIDDNDDVDDNDCDDDGDNDDGDNNNGDNNNDEFHAAFDKNNTEFDIIDT
ncbi:hypothetical protein ACF0H5_010771 [Mactra antiquata]